MSGSACPCGRNTMEGCTECTEQPCRDCGELFPYDPDADRCPACVAELGITAQDIGFHAAMDRGEVTA